MLNEQQLGEYIDAHFTDTLFRLETLDAYGVNEDFQRYMTGQSGPRSTWPEVIRNEVADGRYTYRVHVVHGPLSDYLRYEFEWCYVPNAAAGELIRVLDTSEQHKPDNAEFDEDFWIVDDTHLIRMHYAPDGEFVGASLADAELLSAYRAVRDAAWRTATDFHDYWRRHPHYHRDRHQPAA